MATDFLLYTNKSSVLKKNTRYVQGGTSEVLPNAIGWWEIRTNILRNQYDDTPFPITAEFAYCPDKISSALYGRPDLAWLVLEYCYIVDINEELGPGITLTLPSSSRVYTEILTNSIQYQALT